MLGHSVHESFVLSGIIIIVIVTLVSHLTLLQMSTCCCDRKCFVVYVNALCVVLLCCVLIRDCSLQQMK